MAFGGCEALGSTIARVGGVDILLGRDIMGRATHNHRFLPAEQTYFCEVLESCMIMFMQQLDHPNPSFACCGDGCKVPHGVLDSSKQSSCILWECATST